MTGIYGVNSIGKLIIDILKAKKWPGEIAFIDDDPALLNTKRWDIPVSFNIATWKKQVESSSRPYKMFIALGEKNLSLRQRIFSEFSIMTNLLLPKLADDSSIVANDAQIDAGNVICRGSIIGHEVILKSNSVFWAGSVIEHNSVIGESCYISPNCTISGHVQIGDRSLIGSGSVILPGIIIGTNCLVGAGAVITKNIPDNSVAVGNPARIIRSNIIK